MLFDGKASAVKASDSKLSLDLFGRVFYDYVEWSLKIFSEVKSMNLEPVRVDPRAFYRNYVRSNVPIDYKVSGRHPVISIVKKWWMWILSDENCFDCNDLFVARMEQLLDAAMKVGSAAFIRFEKHPCGDYAGILAECARTVLQYYTSAEYRLPSAFVNNSERAMLVSDRIVLIVKLADTGFVVEEVVWAEQGVSIPVAIAMELIKYWAYCVINSAAYDTPSKMQRALLTFRRKLFERVRLPYDCKMTTVWLSIIAAESVEEVAEEAGFELAADFDYLHATITDSSVTVFYHGEDDSIVVWKD